MKLKDYQQEVLDVLAAYLKLLGEKQAKLEEERAQIDKIPEPVRTRVAELLAGSDPIGDTWKEVPDIPQRAAGLNEWTAIESEAGKPVPNVCLKVPTGGGKTLLAAHAVELLQVDWLRRQTGLALWIVPSQAIYAQTLAALKDRGNPLRQVLDRASAGKTLILEKDDRFTSADIDARLCIMVLMLQSARREEDKVLRMFRGGGDASFFPDETDKAAIDLAMAETPNLETYDLADSAMVGSVRCTLANVLRIVQPVVVLDEAHNAVSELGRRTLAKLNPRFILELTATPTAHSNVLVDVQGRALRDEEMIKLPVNVAVDIRGRWQDTLQAALDKLNELQAGADVYRGESGNYIRPILIVRVDYTGEKQRDKSIHVEDAVQWLVEKGNMNPGAIRRQTAERKELGDDDLMSDRSGVRVVVTKDALREGWDCPFAFVLAILSSGGGATALTQFIGRVLRQPYARLTGFDRNGVSLDQSYVFCTEKSVGKAVEHINKGLTGEGMGDLQSAIRATQLGQSTPQSTRVPIKRADEFMGRRVLLPRVLHKDAGEPEGWRDLDYEADVLGALDWDAVQWPGASTYNLVDDRTHRESRLVDIDAQGGFKDSAVQAEIGGGTPALVDRVDLVRRLTNVVPNPWQADRILSEALTTLRSRKATDDLIAAGRLTLAASMIDELSVAVDRQAETLFRAKIENGNISFRLVEPPLPIQLAEITVTGGVQALQRGDLTSLLKALYTPVLTSEVNGFEKDVALYLDDTKAVGWWWRIAARRDPWGLQGWRAHKVYPDFLVALDEGGRTARLLALETKGKHLNNPDTAYKRGLFNALEVGYSKAKAVGQMEMFGDAPDAVKFEIVFGGDGTDVWRPRVARALR
ncbi:DEAD/DEAH box helicase family protein [Mesorhizobium sp.]|uniref:DEAD/DEAH box helicase n=1 Tax=Mesorhizobium sp. TaxID=1871066 RepID=UPI00257BEC18|nr:DEAD/DEAH box helicase family protein [Mesorhizobium sp.]